MRPSLKEVAGTAIATTIQGSYPRPSWHKYDFAEQHAVACLQRDDFAESYRDAVAAVVHDQDHAGIDLPSSGFLWYDAIDFLASSFLYNVRRFEGVDIVYEPHPVLSKRAAPGERPLLHAIAGVTAAVNRPLSSGALHLDLHWRIAQDATAKPVKAQFGMGPVELGGILIDRHYGSWEKMMEAVAGIYNAQMKAAVANGAKVVQLEDNLILCPPDKWQEAARFISLAFEGVEAYRIVQVTHGGTGIPPGITPYVKMFPALKTVDCDCLAFSSAQMNFRDDEFDAWRALEIDKDLGLGAISNKNYHIEKPEEVAAGVRKALQIVSPDRLLVTTDAGLIRYPRSVAKGKVEALTSGVKIVRGELGL